MYKYVSGNSCYIERALRRNMLMSYKLDIFVSQFRRSFLDNDNAKIAKLDKAPILRDH